jgi:hypothetical protein
MHPNPVSPRLARAKIRPVAVITDRSSVGFIQVRVELFHGQDAKTTDQWDGPPILELKKEVSSHNTAPRRRCLSI